MTHGAEPFLAPGPYNFNELGRGLEVQYEMLHVHTKYIKALDLVVADKFFLRFTY